MQNLKTLLCIVLCYSINLQAQTDNIFYSHNFKKIDLEDSTTFNILDESITNQKLFLFGEVHRVSCNLTIVFSLLRYLHKNHNVRYLLKEYDFVDGLLFNKFLETGDTTYLKYTGAEYWQEERDFIKRLREFNQKLAIKDRIMIVGVDSFYEKEDYITTMYFTKRLILDSNVEDVYLSHLIFKDIQLDSINPKTMEKHLKKLYKDVQDNPQRYKNLSNVQYKDLQTILLIIKNKRMSKRERERRLSKNILKAYQEFGHKGNLLGNFGRFHTQYLKRKRRMINFLKDSEEFKKENIFTINAKYHRCFSCYSSGYIYYHNTEKYDEETLGCKPLVALGFLDSHLKNFSKNNFNLIKVDKLVLEEYKKEAGCDYILFIRNQAGSTYIKEPDIKVEWDFKYWYDDL